MKRGSVSMRIVVLGGRFGGVTTVRHLDRSCGGARMSRSLVSREELLRAQWRRSDIRA